MRARLPMPALLLLAAGALAAHAADPYVVVLRDGCFLRAAAEPVLDGAEARLRLHPSGMLAVIPQGRLDWVATEEANRERPPEPPPPAPPVTAGGGTFTWGGDSTTPVASPPPPPDPLEPTPAEAAALSRAFSRRLAELLRLEKDLEIERQRVEDERDRFDRDLRFFFRNRRLRSALAYELHQAEEELEAIERALERTRRDIRDLHLEAADRNIHVRQLSYPALD